eukprot:g10456.t1
MTLDEADGDPVKHAYAWGKTDHVHQRVFGKFAQALADYQRLFEASGVAASGDHGTSSSSCLPLKEKEVVDAHVAHDVAHQHDHATALSTNRFDVPLALASFYSFLFGKTIDSVTVKYDGTNLAVDLDNQLYGRHLKIPDDAVEYQKVVKLTRECCAAKKIDVRKDVFAGVLELLKVKTASDEQEEVDAEEKFLSDHVADDHGVVESIFKNCVVYGELGLKEWRGFGLGEWRVFCVVLEIDESRVLRGPLAARGGGGSLGEERSHSDLLLRAATAVAATLKRHGLLTRVKIDGESRPSVRIYPNEAFREKVLAVGAHVKTVEQVEVQCAAGAAADAEVVQMQKKCSFRDLIMDDDVFNMLKNGEQEGLVLLYEQSLLDPKFDSSSPLKWKIGAEPQKASVNLLEKLLNRVQKGGKEESSFLRFAREVCAPAIFGTSSARSIEDGAGTSGGTAPAATTAASGDSSGAEIKPDATRLNVHADWFVELPLLIERLLQIMKSKKKTYSCSGAGGGGKAKGSNTTKAAKGGKMAANTNPTAEVAAAGATASVEDKKRSAMAKPDSRAIVPTKPPPAQSFFDFLVKQKRLYKSEGEVMQFYAKALLSAVGKLDAIETYFDTCLSAAPGGGGEGAVTDLHGAPLLSGSSGLQEGVNTLERQMERCVGMVEAEIWEDVFYDGRSPAKTTDSGGGSCAGAAGGRDDGQVEEVEEEQRKDQHRNLVWNLVGKKLQRALERPKKQK